MGIWENLPNSEIRKKFVHDQLQDNGITKNLKVSKLYILSYAKFQDWS